MQGCVLIFVLFAMASDMCQQGSGQQKLPYWGKNEIWISNMRAEDNLYFQDREPMGLGKKFGLKPSRRLYFDQKGGEDKVLVEAQSRLLEAEFSKKDKAVALIPYTLHIDYTGQVTPAANPIRIDMEQWHKPHYSSPRAFAISLRTRLMESAQPQVPESVIDNSVGLTYYLV